MARGWESKAVADQIEEGNSRVADNTRSLSAVDRIRQEKLQSLRLSKSRLLQQLELARNPSHRDVLLKGLRAIERELEQL